MENRLACLVEIGILDGIEAAPIERGPSTGGNVGLMGELIAVTEHTPGRRASPG